MENLVDLELSSPKKHSLSVEVMLDIWNAELKQFADEEDTYNVDSSRMSVHVLNHWKSELSKELGLGVSYKGSGKKSHQDGFIKTKE